MALTKFFSYASLALAPLFFSSNLLFGKAVIPNMEPWTLAFIRWGLVSLILFPFVAGALYANRKALLSLVPYFGIMGFLGMWICGAIVYFALSKTSATNSTLIYLSSPVLIILIEAAFRGRRIVLREAFGIFLASAGVIIILLRGDFQNAYDLAFNIGDVAMVAAAISWAVYGVMFKSEEVSALPSAALLCLFSAMAALLLAPFAIFELSLVRAFPTEISVWGNILGIIFSSSIAAFLCFQHSVRFAGPAVAGIFMYLLPVYGVGLAVMVLGETFERFHLLGILTIMGGVILATFPVDMIKRRFLLKKQGTAIIGLPNGKTEGP